MLAPEDQSSSNFKSVPFENSNFRKYLSIAKFLKNWQLVLLFIFSGLLLTSGQTLHYVTYFLTSLNFDYDLETRYFIVSNLKIWAFFIYIMYMISCYQIYKNLDRVLGDEPRKLNRFIIFTIVKIVLNVGTGFVLCYINAAVLLVEGVLVVVYSKK